jgi:hypothetical protein
MNCLNNLLYGEVLSGSFSASQEGRHEYQYNVGDYDLNNLGILTIVYELDENGKPVDVINITSN